MHKSLHMLGINSIYLLIRLTHPRVLNWIQNITNTYPIVMVIGGYTNNDPRYPNGLTNDIELLNSKNEELCSRTVKPFFGRRFQLDDDIEVNEYDTYGLTGQFVKQVPIVCGGSNIFGNLNECFQFDIYNNG